MFIHFCWLQKRWTLVLRVRRLTCGMGENRKTGIEVLYPHSADKRVIRHHNSLSSRERNSSRPSYTAQHFGGGVSRSCGALCGGNKSQSGVAGGGEQFLGP